MTLTYLGNIMEALSSFSISKGLVKSKGETYVSKIIFQHLKTKGLRVSNEKQIGFLKFYIDIDYDNQSAGVEVKLAHQLIADTGNTGEIQRLFGQIYYYTKNYTNLLPVVMVLVVGEEKLKKDPKIKEIKKHIERMGALFEYFVAK